MIEAVMFFALGFFGATLIALITLSAVWQRAVRLTTKRIEGAIPVSMVEFQADKDQQRAQFAMQMRKLERTAEQAKAREAGQLAEIGRKSEAIYALKVDTEAKAIRITELELIERDLRDRLQSTENALAEKTKTLAATEATLAEKEQALTEAGNKIGAITEESEGRRVNIIALQTLRDELQSSGATLERDKRTVEQTLERRERELSEHLARREGELLAAAETRESELTKELAATRGQFGETQTLAAQLRDKAEAFQATVEILRIEKSDLESALVQLQQDHDALEQEAAALRREADKVRNEERAESALLRERVNDVAAEVARLAINLEGENSPLEEILSGTERNVRKNGARSHLSLADRIRDLQNRAR
jgi:chromosome segregation ATPase